MSSAPNRILRTIVVAIAIGALFLHVANLWLMVWPEAASFVGAMPQYIDNVIGVILSNLAWGVGFAILALVIVVRIGQRKEALFAAFFLSMYSLWGVFITPLLFQGALWVGSALVICDVLVHAIGIRFTQLFPKSLVRSDVVDLAQARLVRPITGFLAMLLNPRIYWPVAIGFEAAIRLPLAGLNFARAVDDPMHELHVVIWIALASTYMYASFRRGRPEDRRRIFWILEGVVVLLVSQILGVALWALAWFGVLELDLSFWTEVVRGIAAWVTLGCFAMAVFFAGAFDAGLVLRRTTVVTLSGMIVLVVFVSLETAIAEVFEVVFGLESRIGGVVAGVCAALAFRPLSIWLDQRVQFSSKVPNKECIDRDR